MVANGASGPRPEQFLRTPFNFDPCLSLPRITVRFFVEPPHFKSGIKYSHAPSKICDTYNKRKLPWPNHTDPFEPPIREDQRQSRRLNSTRLRSQLAKTRTSDQKMEFGLYGMKRPKPRRSKTSLRCKKRGYFKPVSRIVCAFGRRWRDRARNNCVRPHCFACFPTLPNISAVLNNGLLPIEGLQAE
jgi:hypothetical protein